MSKDKKALGNIPALIIRTALSIGLGFTNRIKHGPSQQIVRGTLSNALRLTNALSDSDLNDDAQVKAIVNEMLSVGDFQQGTRNSILANIAKIQSEPVRDVLTAMLDKVFEVGRILTDQEPANGDQIAELLGEFIRTPEGLEFVVDFLDIAVGRETAALVGVILVEAIITATEEKSALKRLEEMKARFTSTVNAAA